MRASIGSFALAATVATSLASPPAAAQPATDAAAAQVATVVDAVAVLADLQAFSELETRFAPTVFVDYESLSGVPGAEVSASALMAQWAGLLPGFDVTRHVLGEPVVTVDGTTAAASVSVTATHWLGADTWTVSGRYHYALDRMDEAWRITRMRLEVESETGDRAVLGRAAARVAADTP